MTLLGKEDQSEYKMPEDQGNNGKGDFSDASNEENILHPTTIDQLPWALRKELKAKSAANVAAALAGCSFKHRSSKVAEELNKPIIITTYTFEVPSTSTSR